MEPLIVNLAPTGLMPTRAQSPHVPLTAAEVAADLPPQSVWSVAGIGRHQALANAHGVVVGHGVRIELEDNLWRDNERTLLATNLQLVERIAAQAAALGRPLASPSQVRRRLDLAPRP